jgi:soluble cytochrome b562
MSMNTLSSTRFAPPQQARLNPHVAQQREGVKFSSESRKAFQQFCEIVQVVARKKNHVGKDAAEILDYSLPMKVREGFEALIGSIDGFRGGFTASPDTSDPKSSIFQVCLERSMDHLGENAKSHKHEFRFSLTSDGDTVKTGFEQALARVRETEEQLYEDNIGSKLPDATRENIRQGANALFGEGGANFTLEA